MSKIKTAALSYRPSENQWTLHVPVSALQKLEKRKVSIRLGAKDRKNRVTLSSSSPRLESFATKIKVVQHRESLTVGPLIGILTVRRGDGFKGNKKNFIDIIRVGKRLGALVYVFAVEDIQWSEHATGAFIYDEKQASWKFASSMPLPDVVYNRIPYREDEEKPDVRAAIERLKKMPSLRLFNNQFFNKWRLYDRLSKHPRVASYIPESTKFQSSRDLFSMIKKHPLLYLKPIDGKAGQGIMTIESDDDRFVLKKRVGSKLATASYDRRRLWEFARRLIPKGYILQQGVSLETYEKRPFDIRVLIQKDRTGSFKLSGIGIRVAGKNSITTHVPRGGSIAAPEVVLKQARPAEYPTIMKRIQHTALEIARALEEDDADLGEMSMDIGLDQDGKLWFFEANAKPMKFDEPHIRKTSLERIIEYSQYLSKFVAKEERSHASKTDRS